MNKKVILSVLGIILFFLTFYMIFDKNELEKDALIATVLKVEGDKITVQDNKNVIYTFNGDDLEIEVGNNVLLEYTGLIDKNKELQEVDITNYEVLKVSSDENGIPTDWLDNGIFKDYYIMASNKLKTLSLEEKIGQLLLVRYPDNNQKEVLTRYNLGGYVFFEKDFEDKTKSEVKNMISSLQQVSSIPLLTAVDEEGGKIVRISNNPNLVSSKFKSSSELYKTGGFEAIKQDTINKSQILYDLGLNVNLAPVVDVVTDPTAYMYDRSFKANTELTSVYAKTVIEASKDTGVSYTLKHFPGYGNNADTHTGTATDNRTMNAIEVNDFPPFEAGIEAKAEAVLVSHNTVLSIDSVNPISLSSTAHNLLRNELNFTGIIIADNLDMVAVSTISDVTVKAILAGNDIIITTDYEDSFNSIKEAIEEKRISEDLVDKLAFRVLAWKYYKGLMIENQK